MSYIERVRRAVHPFLIDEDKYLYKEKVENEDLAHAIYKALDKCYPASVIVHRDDTAGYGIISIAFIDSDTKQIRHEIFQWR